MPVLRVTDSAQEPPPPSEDAQFEASLKRLEKQLREDHEHRFLTEHPEGIGPTLGQNLGGPIAGHGVDLAQRGDDPPG